MSFYESDSAQRSKMNAKEIDKKIKSYSKYYRNILVNEGLEDIDRRMSSYKARLKEMYRSDGFFYSNKERYIVVQKCTNIYRILFTQANICAIIYV